MKSIVAFVVVVFAFMVASCSSSDPVASNQTRSVNNSINSLPAANANTPGSANTSTVPQSPGNEPAPADPAANIRRSRMDAIRKDAADPNTPKLDTEELLRRSAKPAPENSDFAVALTDIVVERRTFHDNTQLIKVEKITQGEKKTLKIYLANGKVVELPGDRLASISTAASVTILKIAGIATPPPSTKKPNAKIADQ